MSWFSKLARIFEEDEEIAYAAIMANGEIFTGPSHLHAVTKAIQSKALFRDSEGRLQSPDGKKHLDLFVTNKGKVIDRFAADQYFGISGSERIREHHKAREVA